MYLWTPWKIGENLIGQPHKIKLISNLRFFCRYMYTAIRNAKIMNNYIRGPMQVTFWASNYIFYCNMVAKSASLVFFLLTAFLIFIALFKLVIDT